MAKTVAGASLTQQQRQAQLDIRARALRDYIVLWPIWTGDENTFQLLLDAALPLVRTYHSLSSATAAGYYQAFRKAEKIGGDPTPRIASPLADTRVKGTLHVTGKGMADTALRAGQTQHLARQNALVRTSGTVSRLVLDGGRQTIIQSVAADKKATGWARVTAAQPCAFCALLASRGPVYKSDTVDFQAHDHCSCGAEPYYPGSEWPGRGKEFRDLYNQHASGKPNPVNELRRVLNAA